MIIMESFLKFERVCRICLNENNTFVSVFNKMSVRSKLLSLAEMLLECATVLVKQDDRLPKIICQECAGQLKKYYIFKKQIRDSEQMLLLYYEKLESEIKVDSTDLYVKNELKEDVSELANSDFTDIKYTDYCDIELKPDCNNYNSNDGSSNFELAQNDARDDDVTERDSPDHNFPIEIKNGTWDCTMCEKTFKKKSELAVHMSLHVGNKLHCQICDKFYIAEWALKNHIRTHSYSCNVCFKLFGKKSELDTHKSEHKDHLPFVCRECGKQFEKKRRLVLHLKIHTGEKNHLCSVCGKSFTLAGNLATHSRIHSGVKPYTCKICNKSFGQWNSLNSHMVNHNGERSFICQTCGNSFTRQGTLSRHMKTHTGERNYPCTFCDKRFADSGQRNNHLLTHTGEKNHKCEICSKAFNRKSNLSVHKKIHTGEKPHICSVCGRGFIQLHVLTSHMNTHTCVKNAFRKTIESVQETTLPE